MARAIAAGHLTKLYVTAVDPNSRRETAWPTARYPRLSNAVSGGTRSTEAVAVAINRAKKKPPEGGFLFKPDLGSGCHQSRLRLPTICHEANTGEANNHHCPSR